MVLFKVQGVTYMLYQLPYMNKNQVEHISLCMFRRTLLDNTLESLL